MRFPRSRQAARAAHRLEFERLEDRRLPSVFTPSTFGDGVSGGSQIKTLRDAIIAANNDPRVAADAIQLRAGTYRLTLQDLGSLTIASTKHALVIAGAGRSATIIDAGRSRIACSRSSAPAAP